MLGGQQLRFECVKIIHDHLLNNFQYFNLPSYINKENRNLKYSGIQKWYGVPQKLWLFAELRRFYKRAGGPNLLIEEKHSNEGKNVDACFSDSRKIIRLPWWQTGDEIDYSVSLFA